jgi:hypothetical protein
MIVTLFTAILSLLQAPQVAPGVIEGVVVRADTGAPIAGAQVQWTSSLDPPNFFNGPNPNTPATTDTDGKFVFKDLKPATYRIAVTASGYVRQEYGQRASDGTGRSIYVSAGQTLRDLLVRLTPAATVSGRVITDMGQPAVEILVQLVQVLNRPEGRTFRGVGMTNADDRGEYRLYGITPGRYYLVAGNVSVSQMLAPGAGDVITIRMSQTNYGPIFYPGASDISGASLLEMKPGSEIRVDLTVKAQQPTFRVSGRVIDADTGQAPASNRIVLTSPLSPPEGIQPTRVGPNTVTTPGVFEFPNVPPGVWMVRAEIPVQAPNNPADPATMDARRAEQAVRPFGQTVFNVTNNNVEGLLVTMSTGTTIPGRFTLENQPLSTLGNLDRISVGFRPAAGVAQGLSPSVSRASADGAFRIAGIREGEYQLRVLGVPAGFYVKSIKYGDADITNALLRFSRSNPAAVEIVLRPGPGQISGTVTNSMSQPVPGIQAILIPEPSRRNRSELYKTVVTDQNGRFSIANVEPGIYKIFSWDALSQNGYYDPDFMSQYELLGHEVRVEESANLNVDVRVIPAGE